ncbi:MAG: DUF695 domain-containing protein [Chthonomonadaceae bacterium]|nr:DUF695 domain-containing protein [Chthonomonadaceae bacterium]
MRPFWKRGGTWRRTTTLSRILDASGQTIGTRVLTKNHPIERSHPDLVYFSMFYASSPLPSSAEMDVFDEAQKRLDVLSEKLDFYQPAIIMLNGKRDWILYARNGAKLISELQLELSQFGPQMECQSDPNWSQFRTIRKF